MMRTNETVLDSDRPWTLWRQPVRRRTGLAAFFLGRQDLDRLTCDQRQRAQILRIEFEGYPPERMTESMVRMVGPIMALPTSGLRFADLQALEKVVFAMRPAYEVAQSLPALRARLTAVDSTFDLDFLACKGEAWDEDELRSAAKYALTMVYEKEAADIVQARKRYDLLRFTGNTAAFLALLFIYIVASHPDHRRLFDESGHVLIATMIVGSLGGVMSSFVTLGNVSSIQGMARAPSTRTAKFGVLVHLIGGFVFSMVMFMLLLGGFIEGAVLPNMSTIRNLISLSPEKYPSPHDFFTIDMAKLMIWGFISGYIGGLIPRHLAKLGRSVGVAESKADAAPQSPSR